MKILSVNAGSSSLKFKAYLMPEEEVIASGTFERIGIDGSFYTIKVNGEKYEKKAELKGHQEAFAILMQELKDLHVVESFDEIEGVGHRVVQGGDKYNKSVVITEEVIKDMETFSCLAPLHNPPAIKGIRAAQEVIPNATHVAVFDTAFHQTMPKENYLYAVPMEWYEKHQVRRYGAHGTSHKYITQYMERVLGTKESKLIICHIGSGASISAVKNGECVNTTMGFTPNAGLIMGTRSGDIDATIIPYIMDKAGMTADEVNNILNKQSGLYALTDGLSDMRDIDDGVNSGNAKCELALKMYVNRIVDYIAKYYFELQGADAIIFTAGVGENGSFDREQIVNRLEFLGVKLDKEYNEKIAGYKEIHEGKITLPESTIPVYVIPTNEEVMIARDTYDYVQK